MLPGGGGQLGAQALGPHRGGRGGGGGGGGEGGEESEVLRD